MNRRVIGLAVFALAFVFCGRGASFASPSQAVTVESSDEQLLLISGSDHQEVESEVNEAAARGFKLVMVSETLVGGDSTGLICLLERCETPVQPAQAYAFVQGLSWNKMSKKVNEFARRGYRVLPWAVKTRSLPCSYCWLLPFWGGDGGWFKVLIVMEQSSSSQTHEYELLVSASRTRLIKKVLRHCEQGYRPITLVELWAKQAEVVLERLAPGGEPIDLGVCGAERFEIVNEVPTTSGRDPSSVLDDLLVDLSSKGYRLLASTAYLSSLLKPSFRGWMLFERTENVVGEYEYVSVEPRESMEETIAAIEEAGAAGFRLHALSLPGLIMEKNPGNDTKSEYLRLGPAKLTELLDAMAAAHGDGFRVVRIWIDLRPERQDNEPEVNALLERHSAEPQLAASDQ